MLRSCASVVALLLAMPVSASVRAVITSDTEGTSIVRASDGSRVATAGMTLSDGDRLTTTRNSCELHFSDGSVLAVAPQTEIGVTESERHTGGTIIYLVNGRIALQRGAWRGGELRVDTDGATYAPAPDAICTISRDRHGRDTVTALAGLTELRTRAGVASLRPGEGALVDAHGTPIVGLANLLLEPDVFERSFLGRVDPGNEAIAEPKPKDEIPAGSWTIDSTRELYADYAYGYYPLGYYSPFFGTLPLVDYGYGNGYGPGYGYGHGTPGREHPSHPPRHDHDRPTTTPMPAGGSAHATARATVALAGSRGEAVGGLERMSNTSITVIGDATLGHPSYRPSSSSSAPSGNGGGSSSGRGWTVVMGQTATAPVVGGGGFSYGGGGGGFTPSVPGWTPAPSMPRGGGGPRVVGGR